MSDHDTEPKKHQAGHDEQHHEPKPKRKPHAPAPKPHGQPSGKLAPNSGMPVGKPKATGAPSPGTTAQAPPALRAHAGSEPERQAAKILTKLQLELAISGELLAAGKAGAEMDGAVVEAMISSLERDRQQLSLSIMALPTGGDFATDAFPVVDQAGSTIARLEAVVRANHGKAETSRYASTSDRSANLRKAEAKLPGGYCDGAAAKEDAHCGLDKDARERYRAGVREIVINAQTAWSDAVNSVHVEERFRSNELTFEQRLGQMLLGLLFDVVGSAAAKAVSKVVKSGTKALTTEWDGYPGASEGPEPETVALVKAGLTTGADKGVKAVEKSAGSWGKSAKALQEEAEIKAPADRLAFLQIMKQAPTNWRDSILKNVDHLYDDDLTALLVGLPERAPSQADFEQSIRALLARFDEQVLTVNHEVRPVQVIAADHKVREALVTDEMAVDGTLKGEARHSLVRTGKMKFVRWIDADMAGMALARRMAQDTGAAMQVRAFDDTSYWDDASIAAMSEGVPAGRRPPW